MNRMFMKRKPSTNIFGMPTTLPEEQPEGAASNESMMAGEYVPPEALTRPTGAYLGNTPTQAQAPVQEQSTTQKVFGTIGKVGEIINKLSSDYWSKMGGPRGDAARENKAMDLKTLLASMKTDAGTNDMQNYKFYADQENSGGREPMSFYAWRESLNKAGAGGGSKETTDPLMQSIQTKIMQKIAERVGVDNGTAPAQASPSGGMTGTSTGMMQDLGGGVKIKFGGG